MKPPTPSQSAGPNARQPGKPGPLIEPILIGAYRAAKLLSISERTLWSMSISGEIPSLKIRRARRYDLRDLDRWIQEQKVKRA